MILPRMLCNRNGAIFHLQTEMEFVEDIRYSLYNWWKYIFCPIWNLLCENGNLKRNFSKKVLYNPLMGCSLFSNYHFQMGVTVTGFAEDFGLSVLINTEWWTKAVHVLLCSLWGALEIDLLESYFDYFHNKIATIKPGFCEKYLA